MYGLVGDDENETDRVIDLDRMARPGDPPVAGAQWDELHGRWERWDEQAVERSDRHLRRRHLASVS